MECLKNFLRVVVYLTLILCFTSSSEAAKSLYVVKHESKLIAFDINSEQLAFQKELQLADHGYGAIDLAVDDESGILFISYEYRPDEGGSGGNIIELVNCLTLEHIKKIKLPIFASTNLTGIVYDPLRSKLYGTKRNSNRVYSMLWDAEKMTLKLESPPYQELNEVTMACDLAINENITLHHGSNRYG